MTTRQTNSVVALRFELDDARIESFAAHGTKAIIARLASGAADPPVRRLEMIAALGRAVASGTRLEQRHADELSSLCDGLFEGHPDAVAAARRWADAYAPDIRIEPSAAVRKLAREHDASDLLDRIEDADPDRRLDLVRALAVRAAMELKEGIEDRTVDAFVELTRRLAGGDTAAIADARSWVEANTEAEAWKGGAR